MSAPAWPQGHPTYLGHALALSALHGPGPWPDGGEPLPDEKPSLLSQTVLDGVLSHHGPADGDETRHLDDLIRQLTTETSDPAALHDAAAAVSALSAADVVARACAGLDPVRVRETGRWLAEHGTRRSAVAIGLVLLGVAGDGRDRELLMLLGALDGLTLYAVVALLRSQPDRERAVYELARRVDGWGRIHAVERLAGTDDPEIRSWLLRAGYRNRILDEYLAYTAATTGDLADALAADEVDDDLLDGAGGILRALCVGGPARDMTDYADGPVAVERYLRQVGRRPPTLVRIELVGRLAGFVADLPWDERVRADLRARCAELTDRAEWRATVAEGVRSDDAEVFRRALWPALALGIPVAGPLRRHLRAAPDDMALWSPLVEEPGDLALAVELAIEVLPLQELATGPGSGDSAWHGPGFVLDLIVSRLDAHPGVGWPLIRAALANESVRNRRFAMIALRDWPADAIPADAEAAVRVALPVEPDPGLRRRMVEFLERVG